MPNDSNDAFAQVKASLQPQPSGTANRQIPAATFRFNV